MAVHSADEGRLIRCGSVLLGDTISCLTVVTAARLCLVGTCSGRVMGIRLLPDDGTESGSTAAHSVLFTHSVHRGRVNCLAASVSGHIASGGDDAEVCLTTWGNLTGGSENAVAHRLHLHLLPVVSVAFSGSGSTLVSLSLYGGVQVTDVRAPRQPLWRAQLKREVGAAAFGADGTAVWVGGKCLQRLTVSPAVVADSHLLHDQQRNDPLGPCTAMWKPGQPADSDEAPSGGGGYLITEIIRCPAAALGEGSAHSHRGLGVRYHSIDSPGGGEDEAPYAVWDCEEMALSAPPKEARASLSLALRSTAARKAIRPSTVKDYGKRKSAKTSAQPSLLGPTAALGSSSSGPRRTRQETLFSLQLLRDRLQAECNARMASLVAST